MGKTKKSPSKDPVEEATVGGENFNKSLEELKKALSILGFEITPKKKPITQAISSPIADVIKESRKRKTSTCSVTEADSSEPHSKRHKHGKHRHHKSKEKGDEAETKLPATISNPGVEHCFQTAFPLYSTPISSGKKSTKRAFAEGVPSSACILSSQTSSSDLDFSLAKMSPLNSTKYLKKHEEEYGESPVDSKKSSKKKQKTMNENGDGKIILQSPKKSSKLASKEPVSQKIVSQSGFGADWTRQEIATGNARKIDLLEKYFVGKKGAKKESEIKEKKEENRPAVKPTAPTNIQAVGKVIKNTNESLNSDHPGNISGKSVKVGSHPKASPSGKRQKKSLMKNTSSDSKSVDAHSTPQHNESIEKKEEKKMLSKGKASPAKKLKMDSGAALVATGTQKLEVKHTKTPPVDKTAKKAVLTNQPTPSAQDTPSEKRKKAKKQKKESATPAFDGDKEGLDIDDSRSSSPTKSKSQESHFLEPHKKSSKKKKKKKSKKKSKKKEEKKTLKGTSRSKKVSLSRSGGDDVNITPVTCAAESSILLKESPSKKAKKPKDKNKPVPGRTSNIPLKNQTLSSFKPEYITFEKCIGDMKQTVKSKNNEKSTKAEKAKGKRTSLSSPNNSQTNSQIESKHNIVDDEKMACEPSEKKSKKKRKSVENELTDDKKTNDKPANKQIILKQTSTVVAKGGKVTHKVEGKSDKKLVSGNTKSSETQKSKATKQNKESAVLKDSKTVKKTLKSPPQKQAKKLENAQRTSKVTGSVKSKKTSGDDKLFSMSFDFDAWEEKMKMIELLTSGGKREESESEEEVPTPTFEDSPPVSSSETAMVIAEMKDENMSASKEKKKKKKRKKEKK